VLFDLGNTVFAQDALNVRATTGKNRLQRCAEGGIAAAHSHADIEDEWQKREIYLWPYVYEPERDW